MNHIWLKEANAKLEEHKARVVTLDAQIDKISSLNIPMVPEEREFSLRNLHNQLANEGYYINKLQIQIACDHDWNCLGGGGQIMTDICHACGASFDY